MNTTENNKLISEFMGFKLQNNPNERFYKNYFTQANGVWGNRIEILHFDSDWNWLMQVVEKIESLGVNIWVVKNKVKITIIGELAQKLNNSLYDTEFEGYDFEYYTKKTKIEAVYNACVTFIEWYNEQNK